MTASKDPVSQDTPEEEAEDNVPTPSDSNADALAAEFAHFELLAANRTAPRHSPSALGSIFSSNAAPPPAVQTSSGDSRSMQTPRSSPAGESARSARGSDSPRSLAAPDRSSRTSTPALPVLELDDSESTRAEAEAEPQADPVSTDARGSPELGVLSDEMVAEQAREDRHRAIHRARGILSPHTGGAGLPWTEEDGLELGCWIQYEDGWITRTQYEYMGWMEEVLHMIVLNGLARLYRETSAALEEFLFQNARSGAGGGLGRRRREFVSLDRALTWLRGSGECTDHISALFERSLGNGDYRGRQLVRRRAQVAANELRPGHEGLSCLFISALLAPGPCSWIPLQCSCRDLVPLTSIVKQLSWVVSTVCMATAQKFIAPELWIPFFNLVGATVGTYINVQTKRTALVAQAKAQAKKDAEEKRDA
ncbi:hypothetical protein P7C70_g6977, partial [Phenoliferia sp. Uapishka_3]